MRALSLAEHTLYADLLDQIGADLFDPDLPENGSLLVRPNRSGAPADHAYYQGYRPAAGEAERGQRFARYLGRADDPAVEARIARFQRVKAVRAERTTTVRALIGAGMPRPDRITGRIVEAVARAGVFAEYAVLIGDAAYQTYGGVLGARLSKLAKAVTDRSPAVQIAVRDRDGLADIRDALHTVDPSFAAEPQTRGRYRSRSGVRVTIVSPDRPEDGASDPIGFLLTDPVQAIVLHGPGIPITVPAPERYAVHALMIHGDLAQAAELIAAILERDRWHALVQALAEARTTGPVWWARLQDGVRRLPADLNAVIDTDGGSSA